MSSKLFINIGFMYCRIYVTEEALIIGRDLTEEHVKDIKEVGYFNNTIIKIEKYKDTYWEALPKSERVFNKLKELL